MKCLFQMRILFAAGTLLFAAECTAQESQADSPPPPSSDSYNLWRKVSYEPNTFGYTYDSNDRNYVDINLSLKWSPVDDGLAPVKSHHKNDNWCDYGRLNGPCLYLAFSTRQAFYWDTRDSSPVIGQRYNPEFFFRFWQKNGDHFDIGYNHESNGQSINSEAAYLEKRRLLANTKEGPDAAKEYISRGWDYWEVAYRNQMTYRVWKFDRETFYFTGRYFDSDGWFQGHPEEVNSWETSGRLLHRSQVDGIVFLAKLENSNCTVQSFCWRKLTYKYTTGYRDSFENDANRIELGVNIVEIPLTIWFSEGYNSDLIDYYRRVKNAGIYLDLYDF